MKTPTMVLGTFLSAMLVFGSASAQDLAVEGRTPASPIAVVSFPNAGSAWQGLSNSPAGRSLINALSQRVIGSSPAWATFQADRDGIESELGFALSPGALFGTTITGVDIYLVPDADEGRAVVVNSLFRDVSKPNAILDRLKKEAALSTGVGFNRPANTIEDTTTGARRTLHLPAFGLFLAAEGNALMAATSQEALRTTINDLGGGLMDSSLFRGHFDPIADEPHNMWFYGPAAQLIELFGTGDEGGEMLANVDKAAGAGVGFLRADSFKLTTFRPRSAMDPGTLRLIASAPPPGELSAGDFLPAGSDAALITNSFSTDTLFDASAKGAEAMGQADVGKMMDQTMAQAGQTLGFDVRRDFLANLGPDFGISLVNFTPPEAAGAMPDGDVVLVAGLKNWSRMAEVMAMVEDSVNPPGGASMFEGMQSGQSQVRYYTGPLPFPGLSPAYSVTSSGKFVFGLKKETVAQAAALADGAGGTALSSSSGYSKAVGQVTRNRNVDFHASMGPFVQLLHTASGDALAALSPDERAIANMALTVLGGIRTVTASYSFTDLGMRGELVLLM